MDISKNNTEKSKETNSGGNVSVNTPISEQLKIGLFGMRNSGKSSLFNHFMGRIVAIVSEKPGTTTDPVTRSMEMKQLGAVTITDTAGFDDDEQDIGDKRKRKTFTKLNEADLILYITPNNRQPDPEEKNFMRRVMEKNKKIFICLTFSDFYPDLRKREYLNELTAQDNSIKIFPVNNLTGDGVSELKNSIIDSLKNADMEMTPVQGLVNQQDFVVLVTPIDLAAPRGRLILPQVETIRDLLDNDCSVMIVKEREFGNFYGKLGIRPKLVITDSQVFHKVAAEIPSDQLLTSFSILFARKKGDLDFFLQGIRYLESMDGIPNILILEACAHHKQADDIGTVKIPRLIRQFIHPETNFSFLRELPDDEALEKFDLVIHCGACMVKRNTVMHRINRMKNLHVMGTNYGLFLAWANGLFPRVLEPFGMENE